MGVLRDIQLGGVGGGVDAVLQFDEAHLLEKEQSPGLVAAVVGHADLGAVRQIAQRFNPSGVDAEGLIVHGAHGHDVGVVLGVEGVKIGGVLEVVGVQTPVLHGQVGLNIVGVLHDLQSDAFLLEELGGLPQDLRMGGDAGAHLQGVLFLAAGGEGEDKNEGQDDGDGLFHGCISFT